MPTTQPEPAPAAHNAARLLDLYRAMRRIRVFETLALEAHKTGDIPGYLHPSIGQEAVPAGVCAHLTRTDRLTSTHRGHGHALAKGADANAMMAELYGKATGSCRGKGGSMHIADFSVGMLGANGIVAGGIPIAVGAAQGLALLGQPDIVACFFGDGAINRGPFMEGMNWAALYKLPVLFVCEDNTFAAFTHTDETLAGPGPVARAQSCGVPGITIDGDDVLAVEAAAGDLVAAIRRGAGPQLLHCKTYRWFGHTSTDPGAYRKPGDLERAQGADPLIRMRKAMLERGIEANTIGAVDAEIDVEMTQARDAARAAPFADIKSAFEDVQDIGADVFDPQRYSGAAA